MAQLPEPKILPLTADEQQWLMQLYTTRLNSLGPTFLEYAGFYVALSFLLGFFYYPLINGEFFGGRVAWMASYHYSVGWEYKVMIGVVTSATFSLLSYLVVIRPLKKDAQSGAKLAVPHVVLAKEYYPTTGQYYLRLSGAGKHIETDGQTYNQAEEGGIIYMAQAAASNYIFSVNDDFLPFSF